MESGARLSRVSGQASVPLGSSPRFHAERQVMPALTDKGYLGVVSWYRTVA